MKTRKIGIIGLGHVGAHVAYSLAVQGIADQLVLVDQNAQKVKSECQDLRDSAAYLPHRVTVDAGDFSDLGDCDVLVNSTGKIDILRANHDRLDEMDFTIRAVRSYVDKIRASGFQGVVVNITNPCDIVTRELALGLGLPKGRVFGTGTGLDTSRLLSALARQTGIDHKSITAYMLGEHGNDQFAPWSCVSFRGKPLDDWAKTDERFRFDREALQKESIDGGWVTFAGKFCTEYGIATTAARMVSIVLHDEKAVMPASAELNGEYGEHGIFVGVPCVIGRDGVEQVVELPLTAEELAKFHSCCEGVRRNMEHLRALPKPPGAQEREGSRTPVSPPAVFRPRRPPAGGQRRPDSAGSRFSHRTPPPPAGRRSTAVWACGPWPAGAAGCRFPADDTTAAPAAP